MANIRIKDLSTTASTTASDDFFGVDGATNGTRKLNAYSPTFGGNLTVSGTGNSSIAGNLLFPVNKYVYFDGSGAAQTATIGVPTGTNDLNIGNNNALLVLERVSGESYFKVGGTEKLRVGASATTLAGNVLLGTTTDSGNGKLQLATHTAASGGIGFGTDVSLYRAGVGVIALQDGVNGTPSFALYNLGTKLFDIQHNGTNAVFRTFSAANGMTFSTGNATTALTLDSSQNATFAGTIKAQGQAVAGTATNWSVSYSGGTANDGGNMIVYGSTHASDANTGRIRVGTTTIASWDSTDFAIGSAKGLKLGNAYQAGAPTATGYVIIKDSTGTSYKIPAVAV